jgi:hypothetical protein
MYGNIPFAVTVAGEVRHKYSTGGEFHYMNYCQCSGYIVDLLYLKDGNRFIRATKVNLYDLEYKISTENKVFEKIYLNSMYKYEYAPNCHKNTLESYVYIPEKEFSTVEEFNADYENSYPVNFKSIWSYIIGE